MITGPSGILRSSIVTSAVAILLAAGAAHSTGSRQIEGPIMHDTAAEQAFADAPFGVDPMVTGPTSAAFKAEQSRLGCGSAVWPDIPLGCYPR